MGFLAQLLRPMPCHKMLGKMGGSLEHAVSLSVPNDELLKRLSGRRTCRDCGAMYHVIFDPPTNAGLCNKCNGELYQRDDDYEDIISSRLEVYEAQTLRCSTTIAVTACFSRWTVSGGATTCWRAFLSRVGISKS